MKTTNYYNTFIEVAEDCPASGGETPPQKGSRTVANIQFEAISGNPYTYTSDDIVFMVYAEKQNVAREDLDREREKFFSKGQPCLRSSPLGKRYGWGVHNNSEGKVAIYALGSDKYEELSTDPDLKHVKAMRSRRG